MNGTMHKSLMTAYEALLERAVSCSPVQHGVQRIEMDCPKFPPLQWLLAQSECPRYYWTDRERRFEMAGVGESDVVTPYKQTGIRQALNHIRSSIADNEDQIRYYGGFRFHAGAATNDRWQDFKDYRFVLPLLEFCRDGERCYFACNLKNGVDKETALKTLRAVNCLDCPTDVALPKFSGRTDLPDKAGWKALVTGALQSIGESTLQKAVLARQSTFHANSAVDPIALTQRLAMRSENVYLFCFQPSADRAFLGASPERLYKRENDRIYSEALAGTRPRGETLAQDKKYERELMQCDKEHREHQIVVDEVCAILKEFCTNVDAPAVPTVMKLACCQHLHTPIAGTLAAGKDDAALLEALHPTPAVGGLPREQAMSWILANEPFERGIYAAPVGWIGAREAEFSVGIRSGLVRGNTLSLYSGAGIVAGANPDEEWRELDAKLANFLAVIMKES